MIEILETIPVYEPSDLYMIFSVVLLILGTIIGLISLTEATTPSGAILGILPLIIGAIMLILAITGCVDEYQYDKYKVIIPKETQFEEVSQYKIIKHYEYSDVYEIVKLEDIE